VPRVRVRAEVRFRIRGEIRVRVRISVRVRVRVRVLPERAHRMLSPESRDVPWWTRKGAMQV